MPAHSVDAACADPVYVLKLQQRVAACLTPRDSRLGAPQLSRTFEALDTSHHGSFAEAQGPSSSELITSEAALVAVLRPIFPHTALHDRDVAALAHLLLSDDDAESATEADPLRGRRSQGPETPPALASLYLLQLRLMTPLVSFQVWDALQRARRVVQGLSVMDAFEGRLLNVANDEGVGAGVVPVLPEEAQAFLERVCRLSGSAAQLLARQCTVHGVAADVLEAGRFYDLVFADTVPADEEFVLLARRFAESTASPVAQSNHGGAPSSAPSPHTTGSLALRDALVELELTPPPLDSRAAASNDAMDFADVPLMARLTSRAFFRLCLRLGAGFRQEESDKLFFYLYNAAGVDDYDETRHPLLPVRTVLSMYRTHFPPATLSLAHIVRCAVTQLIAQSTSDGTAFFRLYKKLELFGSARVPLADFVQALRSCGVPEPAVSDLHLEWLRLQGATRVALLTTLCVPPPPAREAVIAKLFERLALSSTPPSSANDAVTVRAADILACLDVEKLEGKAAQVLGAQWKAVLADYITELEVDELPYTLFSFIWYLLSAGVEDDAVFTLTVWRGFVLSDRAGSVRRTGVDTGTARR